MKVIFIAGPFTGKTAWDIERNIRRAEELALKVAEAGHVPLCPHTNSRFFHGQQTEQFWYDATLELLMRSDGVIMTPDWERSKGARNEHDTARQAGKSVYYHIQDIIDENNYTGE